MKTEENEIKNYYLQEFSLFDGEYDVTFNILDVTTDKMTIIVIIINTGKISVIEYNLKRNREQDLYFQYSIENTQVNIKDFERDEYQKLKKKLKSGDLLIIKSIDRLGRNYDMIIDEWKDIVNRLNVDIVVLDMPLLDTRTEGKNLVGKFISDIVLQILSFVAENERENIKKRQAEGIRIAKEKGKHLGRPKLKLPKNFKTIANEYKKKEITLAEALSSLKMNRSSFYKNLNLIA